jgi:hypothetical protein
MNFPLRLGVGAAIATAAFFGTAQFASAAPTKLTHAEAASQLASAGITISSSGGCTTRSDPNCTSLDQINTTTVDDAIALRTTSRCTIVVTGGTEVGHADLPFSHYDGYKIDIRLNSCVTGFIRTTFEPVVPPALGAEQYRSADGDLYSYEGNHWDIEFH